MGSPQILIFAGEEVPRMALRVLQATHRTFGGNGRPCHLAWRIALNWQFERKEQWGASLRP